MDVVDISGRYDDNYGSWPASTKTPEANHRSGIARFTGRTGGECSAARNALIGR